MLDRESSLEHFRSLGANPVQREINGTLILRMQLCNRKVGDEDLRHLRALPHLEVIGLENTQVTDQGLEYLRGLTLLENVDLTNTSITDAGLEVLAAIPTLEFIHVEGTRVTPEGIAKLQLALPKCEIVWDEDDDDNPQASCPV